MSEVTPPALSYRTINPSSAFEQRLQRLRERSSRAEAAGAVSPDASSGPSSAQSQALAQLRRKSAEAAMKEEKRQAETPQQLFLPGFDIGAFPNRLNRSSLIAPIARGPRKFHRQAVMVTRGSCVLEYRGCAEFCVNGQSNADASRPVRKHHEYQETRRTRRTAVWPAGQLQGARRPEW